MILIESYRRRSDAETSRLRFIEAQKMIDRVWNAMKGVTPAPPPEDCYAVVRIGARRYGVVCSDPSIGEENLTGILVR